MTRKLSKGRRRPRKPTRRLDPAALRELVADQRVWTCIGTVIRAEDGGPHYSQETKGGVLVDILIEFQVQSGDGDTVTARLSSLGGNPARGVFVLPNVGDEYILHFADGQLGEALCGMALSRAHLPQAAAQATTTNVVICGSQVVITDANGGGELPAARSTDPVRVFIPIGVVMVPGSPSPVLNPAIIPLDGSIQSGSSIVRIK